MNLFWVNVKKLVIRIIQKKRITSKLTQAESTSYSFSVAFQTSTKIPPQGKPWRRTTYTSGGGLLRSLFRLLQQSTTGWAAYEQWRWIFHSFRGWKPEIEVPAWLHSGEGLLPISLPVPPSCVSPLGGESWGAWRGILFRALIPFMWAPPSGDNHFSEAPPLSPSSLGISISSCEFGGDFQIIAGMNL